MPSTNNQCLCVPQLTTLASGENYKEKIKVEAHKKGGGGRHTQLYIRV